MTSRFTAVFEHGLLRPTTPVELPEGTSVEVYIVAPPLAVEGSSPADILASIAALGSETVDPHTSARHDDVLYGREAHP